jgi:lipoate-protein ligase B
MSQSEDRIYGWHLELGKVDYQQVLGWQHGLRRMREQGFARDTIITVEHPPVVTVGRDGHEENYPDLASPPVMIERGGDVTYHGPGQLVVYFIFNLTRRGRDLHRFMENIQDGIIETLAEYDIAAEKGDENKGVWTGGKKIASVGIAVKRWMSFHGAAINLNTDLSEFEKISPCGLDSAIMTSAKKILSKKVNLLTFGRQLVGHYSHIFNTHFAPVDLESLAEDVESQAGGYEI